ncbi:RNA polymerase sigma factor [Mariniblastus fucicola]|uniref:ECF RNA polymerase sigma factor SigE n=1 Tax=Mariniblastus fucicola TaxID=980251 RepID=A0A5B9PJZ3_9BACT|nr:sigma-70 family RNA polymerase sigma factor [Mariniblastus fucicola]QEG24996.1 ECF RNA polymerase sigma factor SigE [Mariniblastus fucicola]
MSHDWSEITKSHGPLVWTAVYRILRSHSESLDCYQDVMLEAFEQSKTRHVDNWPGYLRWLAVRRGLDRLRARTRSKALVSETPDIDLVSRVDQSNAASLELEELKARLRSELGSLPALQAEAFWLRFVEQMSYLEIAQQMDLEQSAVGVLIHRAKPRVRKALSDLQPQTRSARSEQ